MTAFIISYEVEFECEGKFEMGVFRKHDKFFDTWTNSVGPDVSDFRVYVCTPKGRFDVTSQLHPRDVNNLKNEWILAYEEAIENKEYENDDAS